MPASSKGALRVVWSTVRRSGKDLEASFVLAALDAKQRSQVVKQLPADTLVNRKRMT